MLSNTTCDIPRGIWMSERPHRAGHRIKSGRLEKAAPADLTVFDPNQVWVVDRDQMKARSKNTPFDETTLHGRVLRTMVAGQTVYQYG